MRAKNIYIMSLAASGKSSFASRHPTWSKFEVVDFAALLPSRGQIVSTLFYLTRPFPRLQNVLRKNPRLNRVGPHYYFDAVAEFLESADSQVIVMGRKLPPPLLKSGKFSSVSLGIVIIPEEQHRIQCNKRRSELRNFIPFFNHWTTDFSKIQELRAKMRQYAETHEIPVFDSFESAANKLAGNNVVERD